VQATVKEGVGEAPDRHGTMTWQYLGVLGAGRHHFILCMCVSVRACVCAYLHKTLSGLSAAGSQQLQHYCGVSMYSIESALRDDPTCHVALCL
jgi:hypothetical protein